jgi:hypothetical protein
VTVGIRVDVSAGGAVGVGLDVGADPLPPRLVGVAITPELPPLVVPPGRQSGSRTQPPYWSKSMMESYVNILKISSILLIIINTPERKM